MQTVDFASDFDVEDVQDVQDVQSERPSQPVEHQQEREDEDEDSDVSIYEVTYYQGNGGQGEYTRYHAMAKSTDRSILADLESLNVGEDVKQEAEKFFQHLGNTVKKGKRRRKLIFYCLFNAFIALGQAKDPKIVAKMVGIPITDMNKAFSMCAGSATVFHSPLEFLPQYADLVQLDSSCRDSLIEFGSSILRKDRELLDDYPQVVAAGILLYYFKIHGVTVVRKDFAKLVDRSEMTISKMVKRVEGIYNKSGDGDS